MTDAFLALAEAMSPAKPPPVPDTPPAITRAGDKPTVPPAVPARPRKHQLPDVRGVLYEHEDLATLRAWLASHNAELLLSSQPQAPTPQVLIYQRPAVHYCGPSGCR